MSLPDLPTPKGYAGMAAEQSSSGTVFLYMGTDFVAFTPPEWARFLAALAKVAPVAACDTITKAARPEYCDRSWHDGDCCEGSRQEYAARPGTITKAAQ